jgi:preprotein translocase subunit SecB
MSDQGNGADAANETQQVKMDVLTQFVRDLSFENVLAQQGTGGEVSPDVQVGVSLSPKKRQQENQYEVVVKLNISSKNKGTEQQLFLLEMEYAGVFHVEGVPDDQLHPFLMIECPRMIFPFIRRIVSDVTRDGGFPPLNLENIDWIKLYRNELARRQSASEDPETPDA